MAAVSNSSLAIKFVPVNLLSKELVLTSITKPEKYYPILKHIPSNILDEEICFAAIKRNSYELGEIPERLRSYELCFEAIKRDHHVLHMVPHEYMTEELCLTALDGPGTKHQIKFIPEDRITDKIREAINR